MADKFKINKKDILSDDAYTLLKVNFDFQKKYGSWETQNREIYDPGNGVAVLLYNLQKQTVILLKQLRIATYLNGNPSGMLIECCAGKLDGQHPEQAAKNEIEEETGYKIDKVKKVMDVYVTPGAVTELLHFYVAEYADNQKINEGGGLEDEQEEIEVMEVPFNEAYNWIATGEIRDAKTVMLLQWAKINLQFGAINEAGRRH